VSDARVLVAGIGNIFHGDDAFGVEVVRRLADAGLPGADLVDFGIRGMDLAFALMDARAAVLVDALPRGGAPGTLYVLDPDVEHLQQPGVDAIETHGMHPLKVLELVNALGGTPGILRLVGCEPEPCPPEGDWRMGLSAPVAGAIDEAVQLVRTLVEQIGIDCSTRQ
jgi:hydrogenase maturation protease